MIFKKEAVIIFDSGVGGLTTLKEILKLKLKGPFIYLADTKNSPYGNKTKNQIVDFVLHAFSKLEETILFKSIILACNTAAIYTKSLLERKYRIPVFSVTDAAVDYFNSLKSHCTVDVLSTTLTKMSHVYKKRIKLSYVKEIECPPFVPLIESEDYCNRNTRLSTVSEHLIGRATEKVEYVILGCTHYPLLLEEIQLFYGQQSIIIDPSKLLANQLKSHFSKNKGNKEISFYITKDNDYFDSFASEFLHLKINSILLPSAKESNFL